MEAHALLAVPDAHTAATGARQMEADKGLSADMEKGRMSEMKASGIDPRTFRNVLGRYPTGVALITSQSGAQRLGMVVGSFTSISLDPPLVGFYPAKSSRTWPLIASTGRFCVNVLSSDHVEICKRFAAAGEDKFAGLSHAGSPGGLPLIDGISAWIECRIDIVHEIGDHYLVVGVVEALGEAEGLAPLVFHRGGYHYTAAM